MLQKSRYFINPLQMIRRKFHQEAAVIGTAQNTNSSEYQVSTVVLSTLGMWLTKSWAQHFVIERIV